MARKSTKYDAAIAASKAIRGIDRANHFANGGTVEGWRGRRSVNIDRKKEASRKACRKGGW